MPIGIVYARESFRKDDLPIERQVDTGIAAVTARGFTPEVHVEGLGHHSGRSEKQRPEWRAVKKRLQDPQVKLLWVSDFSRATRRTAEFMSLVDTLQARHIELVSHRENFNLSTAAGRMIMRNIASTNEYFADDIAERQMVRHQYLRDSGVPVGPPPRGLKSIGRGKERQFVADEDACYKVDGHERTVLDTVQAWLELLTGPRHLGTTIGAALLNQAGYRHRYRDGTTRLLRNHDLAHLNHAIYDPHYPEYPARYAGVLDTGLIQRARERLAARAHRRENSGRKYPPLLLSGLVRCRQCGRRFGDHRITTHEGGAAHHWTSYRHEKGDCPTVQVTAHRIDDAVLATLGRLRRLSEEEIRRHAARVPIPKDAHADRRAFLKAKLMRLEKYLVDGSISEETYRKERPGTERELADLPPPPAGPEHTPEDYVQLLRNLPKFLAGARKADAYVAHALVEKYVVAVWIKDRCVETVELAAWLAPLVP